MRHGARRLTVAAAVPQKKVVFVDGARVPFAAQLTRWKDKISYDLARIAAKSVVDRIAIDKNEIDYVTWGTVVQEVRTNNLAREVTLGGRLQPFGLCDRIV